MATVPTLIGLTAAAAEAALKTAKLRTYFFLSDAQGAKELTLPAEPTVVSCNPVATTLLNDWDYVSINWGRGLS